MGLHPQALKELSCSLMLYQPFFRRCNISFPNYVRFQSRNTYFNFLAIRNIPTKNKNYCHKTFTYYNIKYNFFVNYFLYLFYIFYITIMRQKNLKSKPVSSSFFKLYHFLSNLGIMTVMKRSIINQLQFFSLKLLTHYTLVLHFRFGLLLIFSIFIKSPNIMLSFG